MSKHNREAQAYLVENKYYRKRTVTTLYTITFSPAHTVDTWMIHLISESAFSKMDSCLPSFSFLTVFSFILELFFLCSFKVDVVLGW